MKLLLLLLITVGWFLLPFIPSVRELLRPTDTEPLRVVSRESSAISFFANNFRRYFLSQADQFDFSTIRDFEPATFPDGTPFVRVQGQGTFPLTNNPSESMVDYLVIAGEDTVFPEDTAFLREIYGVKSVKGARNSIYRAILAEEDLLVPEECIILRWAHAVHSFDVGENTRLHGRASAEKNLRLASGVLFEWIAAPVISIGHVEEVNDVKKDDSRLTPFEFKDMIKMTKGGDTYRSVGDLNIPNRSLVTGSLVIKGDLDIGEETVVRGNLKCDGKISIGDGCAVEGSIVTRSALHIGEKCAIKGPIISEEEVTVATGSVIGMDKGKTTISAPNVYLHNGVVIKGMVVAQREGKTV
ncbi:MAG: polymer-forming cytoskeletal protein [Deltaproteobacteria bacterium]|nr:polymer-forming cytoskeletal protein [Deltaproteobacteria bacterium]